MNLLTILNASFEKVALGAAGILGLSFLIAFHELGHFLFCKLFNIHTPSFSIGFGPTIIAKKIGSTLFKISVIPLGGYVEIAGSAEVGQGEQEHASSTDEHSFAAKPFWQKLCVMFGGILFNLIFAYFIFVLAFLVGTPKTPLLYPAIAQPIIASIAPDAAITGHDIQVGDRIVAINDTIINDSIEPILYTLKQSGTNPVQVTILRQEQEHTVTVEPIMQNVRGRTMPTLGVVFELGTSKKLPFMQAFMAGIKEANRWIANTAYDFVHLFSKKDVSEMAGPLMIIAMSSKWAKEGLITFALFLAVISINLAVLNLIPIPILDGGQIVFHSIEAIIRRPLPETIRQYIHIACWILFLILFVYLSWQDLMRIISPMFKSA